MKEYRLKRNFKDAVSFLEETRWFFVFSLSTFFLFFIVGFVYPYFYEEELVKIIKGMALLIEDMNLFELIFYIFLNNIKASFIGVVSGILFGVIPFFIISFNGYLLGFVSRGAVSAGGVKVLWKILPHGIFELPAIILSIGIGMKIGIDILRFGKKNLKHNLVNSFKVFVLIIFPLLLIAAIIEGSLINLLR